MTLSFRAKLFLAAFSAAVIALAVAGGLIARSMRERADRQIENTLVGEAKLAAELLSRAVPVTTTPELHEEAVRLGSLIGARVTFIGPDGVVRGDSAETLAGLAAMENHGSRPEVLDARASGLGHARRHSDTIKIDMLYIAVPVQHPPSRSCASRCRSPTSASSCRPSSTRRCWRSASRSSAPARSRG